MFPDLHGHDSTIIAKPEPKPESLTESLSNLHQAVIRAVMALEQGDCGDKKRAERLDKCFRQHREYLR